MPDAEMEAIRLNALTGRIIGAAMRVHTALGPGLLESAYRACLAYQLRKEGMSVITELAIPVVFEEVTVEVGYRADMVVDNEVIVELKSVDSLIDKHESQLLTHLKFSGLKVGLIMNFNERHLKDGIRRKVNGL